jgi:hypothetical protein
MVKLRKRIVPALDQPLESDPTAISVVDTATVLVTSEAADYPVDHLFDERGGPGGTRWVASTPGDQTIIVAFGEPHLLHRVSLEVEDRHQSRTQELTVAISEDGGKTYREVIRQEYSFSPPGTTFEREEWVIQSPGMTHVRIWIRPDKGGALAYATMTSLRLA